MDASTGPKRNLVSRAQKLTARTKTSRKSGGRAKPKGKSRAKSKGSASNIWLPLAAVALISAGATWYFSNPQQARTAMGGLGQRVQAVGGALVQGSGESARPSAVTAPSAPKPAPTLVSATVSPAPRALPTNPPKASTPAKPETKPEAKPFWTATKEKDIYNALGRRDHEAFRRLTREHNEILPQENGMAQDILTMAVARGKLEDAKFMLATGLSPDRVIKTPADPQFLGLIKNSTFVEAARKDKNVTLLMLAAATGNSKMIVLLQSQGARNRSTSERKLTALDFAITADKPDAIQACLGREPGDESSRIVISLTERTATFLQDGRIQRRTWVSTGKYGHPTPVGRFIITQKHKDWTSTKYHVKMPYFMRLNNGAIGLHAGNVPPYPASHGCIRLPNEEAKTFFQMADIGTVVDIVN